MRFDEDVRRCVGFVGQGGESDWRALGTCFFVSYKGCGYLVTARHIAEPIGDEPFVVRLNHENGKDSIGLGFDLIDPKTHKAFRWHVHADESVDIAIMPANIGLRKMGCDTIALTEDMFATEANLKNATIGVGDMCYAVGLFRLMTGRERNLPFVHTGHIGLMPGEERIPVRNWRRGPNEPATIYVDGYLCELTSLEGLSGSPVFVRASMDISGMPIAGQPDVRVSYTDIMLLGVWQNAWEGEPDEHVIARGAGLKVPVGVGSVAPVERLIEILEQPSAVAHREDFLERKRIANEAKPD
ncbi:MAG: hypothetical protein DCF16_07335 [Alphaproteobacteria bacterium]|nr:MAG: hypothetical protein DCF16_07335 [Alphaproteobacteria bacterium]